MRAVKRVVPFALVVIAALAIHARVLAGDTWNDVRYHIAVAPPRLAAAAQIHAGAWPGWWEGTSWGVPLAAEPSHGATTPLAWIASTPHGLDLVLVGCIAWLALGVALWARRAGASPLGAAIAGGLAATTGVVTSAALRGVLPGVMWLPWVGYCALGIAGATSAWQRSVATKSLGWCLGLAALGGDIGVAIDAAAIAIALGGVRAHPRAVIGSALCGLAIGCVLWIPACSLHGAGATVSGIGPLRAFDVLVPGMFGSTDPSLTIYAIGGADAWPTLFVGAPVIGLAFAAAGDRKAMRWLLGALGALALLVGRGGWPATLGAPEIHLASLALLLCVRAGRGVDALLAGERRARRAILYATIAAVVATWCIVGFRDASAPAADRALVDGGIGGACLIAACFAVRSARMPLRHAALALIVLPNVVALHGTSPTAPGELIAAPSRWVTDSIAWLRDPPRRAYRPPVLAMKDVKKVPDMIETLADALDTMDGTSGAPWGVGAARSDDPARSPDEDAAWLASQHGGGMLFERFGVGIAILPTSVIENSSMRELDRRDAWAIAAFPTSPTAVTVTDWRWVPDVAAAFKLLFPADGSRGVPVDTGVLVGSGPTPDDRGVQHATTCTADRWDAGAIDLKCGPPSHSYAVIASAAAPGWRAFVDGAPTPWLVADGLRRAVYLSPGKHAVAWRYSAPNLGAGCVLALAGAVALGLLAWLEWRRQARPSRRS